MDTRRTTRQLFAVPCLLLALLLVSGCASIPGLSSEESSDTAADETPAPAEEGASENTAGTGEGTTTDSGLQYIEEIAGTGREAEAGSRVSVHYTGTLEDGTVFDSSYDRGEPFSFVLGAGQVIPGWDEGIDLMAEGGKGRLVIPSDLAYGEQGAGGVIPGGATLTFDVELVAVEDGPPGAPAAAQDIPESDFTTTDSGLMVHDMVVGEGDTAAVGDTVVVNYTGWLEDGTKFDSSLDRGDPFVFSLGIGQVIAGWDEGVAGMQPGGERQLIIPAELGYGEAGAGSVIPPNATLIFEVTLEEIR